MLDLKRELVEELDDLARRAINLWGVAAQIDMAREETTEFLLELARIPRGRHSHDNILEEAVDVYIMMTEIFLIYGPEKTNAMLEKKLGKFQAHLEKSEQNKDAA
jgi:hypothetical protein